ncbi:hypothetical protein ABT065_30525 [Streptomyces sp. NPDC002764]|uniref:hypothetical protein n=1 Tax=Streptomyces sp. NPDC002764 TaxID=3154428 RepID=UPI003319EEF1
MPRDHVTGHRVRAGAGRASRAGTCARAGLFAVLGTVLAAFGHHAIAEGAAPWRFVGASVAVQFVAVWPLARRRYTPAATVLWTLATQAGLHLTLSYANGDAPAAMPGRGMHAGHTTAAVGDGHAWHHAGTAMTTVHVVTALVVALLLCRADARMTAAPGTVARAAVAALAHMLARLTGNTGRPVFSLPGRRPGAAFEVATPAWDDVLEYAVVRRGPPRREYLQHVLRSRPLRDRSFPYQQGAPLCPCPRPSPHARRRAPAAVQRSPLPSR